MSVTSPQQQDLKERVRQATDIVDLVGSYLQLRRQGRLFVALCPWHDDSRPSLQVNPERQSWKCWVCDIGGDVFSFLMRREGVDFREALTMLADRAGIPVTAAQPAAPPGSPSDRRTLYDAVAWAEQEFCQCLAKMPEAEPARAYVHERGLTASSIERFHLGYSPEDWQWLLERARRTRFKPAVLEAAGLLGKSPTSGRYYDRFRGRVIFSIRNAQGRPIAFGGRVLPGRGDEHVGKYINSPETPLFSKSEQLYGLDFARNSASLKSSADAKNREIIVVEGYTDTIMAHQVGVDNVAAVLGTALTPQHIRLLRGYVDRIILMLDGDEAGRRRTNQIVNLFIAEQVDLRVLTLPDELDPCEFLLERGAEPFRQLLAGAVDALEHKIRIATAGIDLARDTHRANQALEEILATIARAPRPSSVAATADSGLRQQQTLTRLSRLFSVPENELRTRLNDLRRRPAAAAAAVAAKNTGAVPPAPAPRVRDLTPHEIELLEILCAHPEFVGKVIEEVEPEHLRSAAARQLLETIARVQCEGHTPDFGNVLNAVEDPALQNVWVELDERARAKAAEAQQDALVRLQGLIDDFRYELETRDGRRELAALEEKRLNENEELDALQRLIARQRNRQGISSPMDGQDA